MRLAQKELEESGISDEKKLYDMVGMDEERMMEARENHMAGLRHNDIGRYRKFLDDLERVADVGRDAGIKEYLDGKMNASIYSTLVQLGLPLALENDGGGGWDFTNVGFMTMRNKNMAARMRRLMAANRDRSFIFAVNVYHLFGPGRIQDALMAAECDVRRVPPEAALNDEGDPSRIIIGGIL